jgi:hypothetical protein
VPESERGDSVNYAGGLRPSFIFAAHPVLGQTVRKLPARWLFGALPVHRGQGSPIDALYGGTIPVASAGHQTNLCR